MKNVKYILLSIIGLFIFTPSILASTNEVCKRTSDNNYHANKTDVKIPSSKVSYAKSIPCVDSNEYVYDFGEVLTIEEEKQVAKRMKEFEDKYHIAIMYYSYDVKYRYGEEDRLDDYAHDFYDLNDFGINYDTYAGVYLFENAYKLGYDKDKDGVDDGFYFNAGSKGSAQLYFYNTRLDDSLDVIYKELKYGNKARAIIKWVDTLEKYYEKGPLKNYTLDEHGNLKKLFVPEYLLITIISGVITGIIIGALIKKNKMVKKAREAGDYLDKGSINITKSNDKFIRTHTSSYTVSSSSSGGGHHSGGGSFSGGHSSGGGRH